jgi:PST family polysaccharide transporter
VNEQAEISILLALPGVLVTIALAPWIIHGFYSSKFDQAAEILCWQVAGMLLRVAAWPMGFIVIAKGRAALFFISELAAYSVYALLAWIGLKVFGLPGLGMAFLGLNLFHWCLVWLLVKRVSGFEWSTDALRLTGVGVIATATVLTCRLAMYEPWATAIGCLLSFIAGLFCLKTLVSLIGVERAERYFRMGRIPLWMRRALGSQTVAAPVP